MNIQTNNRSRRVNEKSSRFSIQSILTSALCTDLIRTSLSIQIMFLLSCSMQLCFCYCCCYCCCSCCCSMPLPNLQLSKSKRIFHIISGWYFRQICHDVGGTVYRSQSIRKQRPRKHTPYQINCTYLL